LPACPDRPSHIMVGDSARFRCQYISAGTAGEVDPIKGGPESAEFGALQ